MSNYIEKSEDLLRLLNLEDIPADEVKEGDIILADNDVVAAGVRRFPVDSDDYHIHFNSEPAPNDPGYVRCIVRRPKDLVKRVPKAWLADVSGG